MNVSITVMAHPYRTIEAEALIDMLHDMPFSKVSVVYDQDGDEWRNGAAAWRTYDKDSDWHVVLQDDAIIHMYFYNNLMRALTAIPEDSIVSLYTGTVRPEQERVVAALANAAREHASWLTSNSLYWGVGVAIPTKYIEPMLERVAESILPYDRRLGSYFAAEGKRVYYVRPSLVDHDCTLPSLVGNDRPGEPRMAHNYCPNNTYFNSETVRIA